MRQAMSDTQDPRVLFAAERTLLAWTRTSLTLMGFGFLIERFGLFLQAFAPDLEQPPYRGVSFWVGLAFIALGTAVAALATVQYRMFVRRLKPEAIPSGYWKNLAVVTNVLLVALGIGLTAYVIYGFR
jgi:putative membrane protein